MIISNHHFVCAKMSVSVREAIAHASLNEQFDTLVCEQYFIFKLFKQIRLLILTLKIGIFHLHTFH